MVISFENQQFISSYNSLTHSNDSIDISQRFITSDCYILWLQVMFYRIANRTFRK